MVALEVCGLTKEFDVQQGKKTVLDTLDLCIDQPGIYGIIGENGAGKTTFFKCLVGLLEPERGVIKLDGEHIEMNRKSIKVLFDGNRSFYWNLTGRENMKYFAVLNEVELHEMEHYITLFKLEEIIDLPAGSYSRGMKQRLALAISFLSKPKILLLDEPTHGLDIEAIVDLEEILRDIAKTENNIILLTSHDHSLVYKLVDEILIMSGGKLVKEQQSKVEKKAKIMLESKIPDHIIIESGIHHYIINGRSVLSSAITNTNLYALLSTLTERGVRVHHIESEGVFDKVAETG